MWRTEFGQHMNHPLCLASLYDAGQIVAPIGERSLGIHPRGVGGGCLHKSVNQSLNRFFGCVHRVGKVSGPIEEVVVDYDSASALRDWAQGFLYGFGLSGDEHIATLLSPEGQEALHDFYEIGNMDVPEQPAGEEEQQALAEIEEYLRVAAMLINEDMHVPKPTGEVSHEIH